MAELTPDRTIKRTDSPADGDLDFTRLRDESIEYLGKLSGKIWTDHNLHDPGITTIEMLCYALLDLGYRTSFPAVDIFARNPENQGEDDNFQTASMLLTCNPLTITDYRKLLVDVEGVRNAWLEAASDVKDLCRREKDNDNRNGIDCKTFLNGLYHVYIELEEDKTDPEEKADHENEMLERIKNVLMSHRNLCEDVADIHLLCKLDLGICADIELESGVDPETVYKDLVTSLQDFLDPSPKFYTLPEMLDKEVSMDEIYSGRPYNLTSSHGFTDTAELEKIVLKKEVHLSDIYALLTGIPGIRTVRRLKLNRCLGGQRQVLTGWKYLLPENHIPVFSVGCSTISFYQDGKTVKSNFAGLAEYFELRFSGAGKLLFTGRFPYLDAEIPKGNYRRNIEEYYSIQHEFPRVYGIGEGGLPSDAPARRQAQALQFKGYLLFFDQLLANYLMQLKNTRSLFSFTTPAGSHSTYFPQHPASVPELDKLLRFGETGSSPAQLVKPVGKSTLMAVLEQSPLNTSAVESVMDPFYFDTEAERETGIAQLVEDFQEGNVLSGTITTAQSDSYFYFSSFSDNWAIVSKRYSDGQVMQKDLSALLYLAGSPANYRNELSPSGDGYTFSVHSGSAGYLGYLGRITEDEELYRERRTGFVDHLLSRFSETFTDFALLSFANSNPAELKDRTIKGKETLLSQYGLSSSNRGKAFDYLGHRTAVSGFETRVKLLAGMDDCPSADLCNFVVDEFEEQFVIYAAAGQDLSFVSDDKFYSATQAQLAVRAMFNEMQFLDSYEISHDRNHDQYGINIRFGTGKLARVQGISSSDFDITNRIRKSLHRLVSRRPSETQVFTSQFVFRLDIGHQGAVVGSSKEYFNDEKNAADRLADPGQVLSDPAQWNVLADEARLPERIYIDRRNTGEPSFIDLAAFKIDIDNSILGKPGKYSFEALDTEHQFKIVSSDEFDSAETAELAAHQFLTDLSSQDRYTISPGPQEDHFRLHIPGTEGLPGQFATLSLQSMNIAYASRDVTGYVRQHFYTLSVNAWPFRYRYAFYLDNINTDEYLFHSEQDFELPDEAYKALLGLHKNIAGVGLQGSGEKTSLVTNADGERRIHANLVDLNSGEPLTTADPGPIAETLELKKILAAIPLDAEAPAYESFITNDIGRKNEKYVYRLVDKGNIHAVYIGEEKGYDTAAAAAESKLYLFQDCDNYEYIDICRGGDIFCIRVDDRTGQLWYHYQIKINYPVFPGGEPVLFESVLGYLSEDDAQNAFDSNYLEIMNRAMKLGNYGPGQYISVEELLVHDIRPPVNLRSVVYITSEEKARINAYNDSHLVNALASLSMKFPIRLIRYPAAGKDEWEKRFPCLPIPGQEDGNEDSTCPTVNPTDPLYYFVLCDKAGKEKWQSPGLFETAAEARAAFHFLLPLLCYPGNYFTTQSSCNCTEDANGGCQCKWNVYIREVLAESTGRFVSTDLAWKAVDGFICVSQVKGSYHRYFSKRSCGFSYVVACARGGWIHPCSYPDVSHRNKALDRLFRSARDYFGSGYPMYFSGTSPDIIYDDRGKGIGRFTGEGSLCSHFLKMNESIRGECEFSRDGSGYYLSDADGNRLLVSTVADMDFEEWKERILEASYYFPVVTSWDKEGRMVYCVEVRLPGFNKPKSDDPASGCGCGPGTWPDKGECYLAWKSDCCFTSCEQAMDFYNSGTRLFTNHINYYPVIECGCGGYGIELIPAWNIIAVNPQSYPTITAVCDAVDRAGSLVNCEGMHLVEHILLRPRCIDDCNCDFLMQGACEPTECAFTWKNGDQDDICNIEKEICFVPGSDPYSFIATVALPSWPERLRSPESRRIMENLLYREAPAHVLLRILWLGPKDLNNFEAKQNDWLSWLGWKNECAKDYSLCNFLDYLLNTSFGCPEECTACLPCDEPLAPLPSCFTDPCDQIATIPADLFRGQVNELYCWKKPVCEQEEAPVEDQPVPVPGVDIPDLALGVIDMAGREKKTAAASNQKPEKLSEEDIERMIDARFTRYRDNLEQLIQAGGADTNMVQVANFFKSPRPAAEDYIQVINSIILNEKPKGRAKKVLTRLQQRALIDNVTFYFLDNVVFYDLGIKKNKELTALFSYLKKQKLLPVKTDWDEKELRMLKPGAGLADINKLLK